MEVVHTMEAATEPGAKRLYRAGGAAAFVLVAGYLLTFPIYAWVGDAPPHGAEAQLAYFARHAAGWWTILGLMVFTDLLYLPIYLALCAAVRADGRSWIRLAAACLGLFVVLDLALTWTAYSALLVGGREYAMATTAMQRAAWVAVAGYPVALLTSPLLGVYTVLLPSLGALCAGLAMRQSTFAPTIVVLAYAVGLTGVGFMGSYFIGALGVLRIANALLVTGWYLLVGRDLCRRGWP